jgi:hypothetical protein
MPSDLERAVSKAQAAGRKLAAKNRLVDLQVVECSFVDRGANNYRYLVVKRTDSSRLERAVARAHAAFAPTVTVRVAKAEQRGEQRIVTGVVLEPETPDLQGDVYSREEVERAAHGYMRHFRNVGLMHKAIINDRATLIESWVEPEDRTIAGTPIKAGTWLASFHVHDDELWRQVRSGELGGLSIGGFASKTPA